MHTHYKAFIIHGSYGSPSENWIPWLYKELAKLNIEVITPAFPTPENQSLPIWIKAFQPYMNELDQDTIMIGHSLGVPFILRILEKINSPINTAFFIAGFHTLLNNPIDGINKTFVSSDFDWKKIKTNCKKFVMFSGANDPYISIEISNELAQLLDADYRVIEHGGHLNKTAGYTRFEPLLNKIKEIIAEEGN